MKRLLIGMALGLLAGALLTWLSLGRKVGSPEPAKQASEAGEKEGESHAHETSPEEVKLERTRQEKAGLQTSVLREAEWKHWIVGYGRALDPAPLATALLEIETASTAAALSAKDYARTKALFAQNQNASLQAVEAAEAALKRDELLRQSAQLKLVSLAGADLAGRADLAALGRSLVNLQAALIRIDLLPGQIWNPPGTVRVAPLARPENLADTEWIGPAPNVDPGTQGLGFLFLLRTNVPAPGTAMLGQFADVKAPEKGWVVPDAAVVRHLGASWFFVREEEEKFERRLLESNRKLPEGWFVTEGITATNQVVIQGAQLLLSEQLKGAAAEE